MRIGFGYDSHRFAEGRRLVLGGIEFPGETGLARQYHPDFHNHPNVNTQLRAAAQGDKG